MSRNMKVESSGASLVQILESVGAGATSQVSTARADREMTKRMAVGHMRK